MTTGLSSVVSDSSSVLLVRSNRIVDRRDRFSGADRMMVLEPSLVAPQPLLEAVGCLIETLIGVARLPAGLQVDARIEMDPHSVRKPAPSRSNGDLADQPPSKYFLRAPFSRSDTWVRRADPTSRFFPVIRSCIASRRSDDPCQSVLWFPGTPGPRGPICDIMQAAMSAQPCLAEPDPM
jgi:hypothetical protein